VNVDFMVRGYFYAYASASHPGINRRIRKRPSTLGG
jgi:hypothetical protein